MMFDAVRKVAAIICENTPETRFTLKIVNVLFVDY